MTVPTIALDWGGVLVADGSKTAWRAIEKELGIPERETAKLWYDELQIKADLGEIDERYIWRTLATLGPVHPEQIREVFLEQYVEIPQGVTMLRAAHAAGWQIVLATNNVRSWFGWWGEKFDWLGLIDEVCCSSDLGVRKPEAAFYEHLRRVMTDPAGFFVDDNGDNVKAATRAGIQAILADDEGRWRPPRELLRTMG